MKTLDQIHLLNVFLFEKKIQMILNFFPKFGFSLFKYLNLFVLSVQMELMDMATTAVAYREVQDFFICIDFFLIFLEQYLPLLKLSYENVALYTDIFTSVEHKISATFVNLLSEYFPMGNLDKYLQKLRNDNQALDRQVR